MQRYKLRISYDGTEYSGWQIQPNGVSIQEVLQNLMSLALDQKVALVGAGRTDAGVHARGQVAHFDLPSKIECSQLSENLNTLLPPDIRILSISEVPDTFHARYSARKKTYLYKVCTDSTESPLNRRFYFHYTPSLDMELLKSGATKFIGTHDFRAFANESHKGAAAKGSVRTLYKLDVSPIDSGFQLRFQGDGFLYKMVRNITGTLLDIGRGKIPLEAVESILSSKMRCNAGKAAPAKGLTLESIEYS